MATNDILSIVMFNTSSMHTSLQISSASLSVTSDVINLEEDEDLLTNAVAGVRVTRFFTGILVPGGGFVGEHGAGGGDGLHSTSRFLVLASISLFLRRKSNSFLWSHTHMTSASGADKRKGARMILTVKRGRGPNVRFFCSRHIIMAPLQIVHVQTPAILLRVVSDGGVQAERFPDGLQMHPYPFKLGGRVGDLGRVVHLG